MVQRLRASSASSAYFVSVSRSRKHYLTRLLISQLYPREDSSHQREPEEVAHPSREVPGGAKSDSGCGAQWIERGPETGLQGLIVVSPVSAANLLARIALPLTLIWHDYVQLVPPLVNPVVVQIQDCCVHVETINKAIYASNILLIPLL